MDQDALQAIYDCMEAAMGPDDRGRAAEARLAEFAVQPGFFVGVFQLVCSEAVPEPIRIFAAIYMKNNMLHRYDGSRQPPIEEETKNVFRGNILEALIHCPRLVRNQLEVIYKDAIIVTDFPEQMPDHVDKIVGYLTENPDPRCIHGACLAIRLICKRYEYKERAQRLPMDEVVHRTFDILESLFANLVEIDTQESAEVQKLILKSYWSALYMVSPAFLHEFERFRRWLELFVGVLRRPIAPEVMPPEEERRNFILFKIKVLVMEIINRYFHRYGIPSHHDSDGYKEFAKYYMNTYAAPITELYLHLLDDRRQGNAYMTEEMLQQAFQYLETAVRHSKTWLVLKPNVEPLFKDIIFPLTCFSDEDNHLFNEDPSEFTRRSFDIVEDFASAELAAVATIVEMIKVRTSQALPVVASHCQQVFEIFQASPTLENACMKYGAFQIFGAISQKLILTDGYTQHIETMLLTQVCPDLTCDFPFLRAKAAWCCGEYFNLVWSSVEQFGMVLLAVRERCRDPVLPVRVSAVISLQKMIRIKQAKSYIRPILEDIVMDIFSMMNEIDNDDVVASLECLVARFGHEIAPLAERIARQLVDSFSRMFAQEQDDNLEEETRMDRGLAAMNCLRALNTLADACAKTPEVYPGLETVLYPFLCAMCTPEGIDLLEEVLGVINSFCTHSPVISDAMWDIFGRLYAAFMDWAFDYLKDMLPCIGTYIARGTDVFLHARGGEFLEMAITMVNKATTHSKSGEYEAQYGCKLAEIIIHYCIGQIDEAIPRIIDIAIKRLRQDVKTNAFRVALIEMIANCMYYNPVLTVAYLESRGVLDDVFRTWGEMLPHFSRFHDKKLCILALMRLFGNSPSAYPASLHPYMKGLLDGTFSMVEALLHQITEMENADQSTEDEEEIECWGNETGIEDGEDLYNQNDLNYMKNLERQYEAQHARVFGKDAFDDFADIDNFALPISDISDLEAFVNAIEQMNANPEYQPLMASLDAKCHALFEAAKIKAIEEAHKHAQEEEQERQEAEAKERNRTEDD